MSHVFAGREQDAWSGFLEAHGRMNRLIEADLQANAQLTHVEFEVLLRLSWEANRRLRLQDLAAQSILSTSGMSRAVERLQKAGLVNREEAEEDRRGAYAVLTTEGADRLKRALQTHSIVVRDHFLDKFSNAELEVMAGFWARLRS